MRLIAGQLGGRTISSPHSETTHPMADKVRGALFNSLGDIAGLTVLDAFAGSGALGLEALSRQAATALLIDSDRAAQLTILKNIASLEIQSQVNLVKANCSVWSDNNPYSQFDVILIDPPFDNLQLLTVQKLVRHLGTDGIFVLNWPAQAELPDLTGLEIIRHKSYAGTRLIFYRRCQ